MSTSSTPEKFPKDLFHYNPPPNVSSQVFHIAGILTTVYGLEELSPASRSVSCLWLLHPRLRTAQIMESVASSAILDWNKRLPPLERRVGLIAVAFDQRNHGSRLVNKLANEAWRAGNKTHAQDMFSIYRGTAMDTSLLIEHLGSYILQGPDAPTIEQHIVLGISLGGHAAWQVLFSDSRVSAGVVIIGCPDYLRLMSDRARLSKLPSYTSNEGSVFIGSRDFPAALLSSVQKWDPRGILFPTSEIPTNPSGKEQERLRNILDSTIKGKRMLVCSGGADPMVPYRCAEPFMSFLKEASKEWYNDGQILVDDRVYEGARHWFTEAMLRDSVAFISDTVAEITGTGRAKI